MADTSLSSPRKKHFFQPLLPSFYSHLNIPIKFFTGHIEGKHKGNIVKLRSGAFERTWNVKMDCHRLTNGWREFVEAHSLRVRDFVVFRHEGDLLFHVTALGSSLCEIQYSLSGRRRDKEEEEESEESDRESSDKESEENQTTESKKSLLGLNSFSQNVTASNLSRDCVGVPTAFAKRNGLGKESQEIVLMNEEGKSRPSELKFLSSCRFVIIRGWTSFCTEHSLGVGDSCTFRLLRDKGKLVFRLCSSTKAKKIQTAKENIAEESRENRFVKLTPTLNSFELGKQAHKRARGKNWNQRC